jgi:hypothetical protein
MSVTDVWQWDVLLSRAVSPARQACLLAALGLLVACGSSSQAASGDVNAAQVQGAWAVTVSVEAITGPASQSPLSRFPIGHRATDKVWFQSDCPSPGRCTLQLWGQSGPDSTQVAFFSYFSQASGLQGPPVSIPMVQSGDTYSATVPIAGFGGPIPCSPPTGSTAPEQRLTLRVTGAKQHGSGWQATALAGSETYVSGWGCGDGKFTGWVITHLGIAGRPSA